MELNIQALWVLAAASLLAGCTSVTPVHDATPVAGATPGPTQWATGVVDFTSRAKAVVDQLAAGKFEEATTYFNSNMKNAAPASKLKTIWEELTAQVGAYQGQISSMDTQLPDRRVITITCQFEMGAINAVVAFDPQGQITGLNFAQAKPSGSASL